MFCRVRLVQHRAPIRGLFRTTVSVAPPPAHSAAPCCGTCSTVSDRELLDTHTVCSHHASPAPTADEPHRQAGARPHGGMDLPHEGGESRLRVEGGRYTCRVSTCRTWRELHLEEICLNDWRGGEESSWRCSLWTLVEEICRGPNWRSPPRGRRRRIRHEAGSPGGKKRSSTSVASTWRRVEGGSLLQVPSGGGPPVGKDMEKFSLTEWCNNGVHLEGADLQRRGGSCTWRGVERGPPGAKGARSLWTPQMHNSS